MMSYWTKPDKAMQRLLKYISGIDMVNTIQPIVDKYSRLNPDKKLTAREMALLRNKAKLNNLNIETISTNKDSEFIDLLVELSAIYIIVENRAVEEYQKLAPNIDVREYLEKTNPFTGSTLHQDMQNDMIYRAEQITKKTAQAYYQQTDYKFDDKEIKRFFLRPTKTQYVGLLDKYMTTIVSTSGLELIKDRGYKTVIFRAVIDNRTTETCRNLNGSIIQIDKLVAGVNQPPITTIPHPCRSWLEGYRK